MITPAMTPTMTPVVMLGEGGGGEGGGEGEGGGGEGGDGGGGNGALPGGYGGGAGQVETEPEMPVRVVDQEQTVSPEISGPTATLGPWAGSSECDATERLLQWKVGTSFSSPRGGILQTRLVEQDRIPNEWRVNSKKARHFPIGAMGTFEREHTHNQ